MEPLLVYLPFVLALACPISMSLMMWYMGRSHDRHSGNMQTGRPAPPGMHEAPGHDAEMAALKRQLLSIQEKIQALDASTEQTEQKSSAGSLT